MSEHDQFGPPPVEPMSDVAWARVERGLWSRMDSAQASGLPPHRRASRRWIWLAMPAIVAAAAAIAVVRPRPRTPAATPPTTVADLGPSRVVSGAAPSSISFGDIHIALDADTAIVTSREGDAAATLLEHGAAWFTVAPREHRPAFVVRAGDTVVRVVGTRFRVARSGEQVSVEVDRGTVEAQFRGLSTRIGPNQHWSSDQPEIVGGSETAESVARPVDRSSDKTATRPASPVRPSDLDPDRAKFERLSALETKDANAALAGYLELSRGSKHWAEVALYAAGRLAVDRHDNRAETLLQIYLRRFPAGANAEDARGLLSTLKGKR